MQRILIVALAVAFALPVLAQDDTPTKKIPATQPSLIKKKEPSFPQNLKRADGSVLLKLVIDTDGRAQNIQVVKSFDHDYDEAAISTVKEWVWRPGTKNGEPVSVYAQVEVNFRSHMN